MLVVVVVGAVCMYVRVVWCDRRGARFEQEIILIEQIRLRVYDAAQHTEYCERESITEAHRSMAANQIIAFKAELVS